MYDFNHGRKFWFGKHKGKYILEIIHKWGHYIEWCQKNVKDFKLNDEESEYYKRRCKEYLDYWNNWGKKHYPRGEGQGNKMWLAVDEWLENPKYDNCTNIMFADFVSGLSKTVDLLMKAEEYDEDDSILDYPSLF